MQDGKNTKDAHCPTWETLPVEVRREVILRHVTDRDLGACLLAASCFHVLAAPDLDARRYAHATVEGMCCVGDVHGLMHALSRRPADNGVDWLMCLHEANAMGHGHVIDWILDHVPPPADVLAWRMLPELFAAAENHRLACRLITYACLCFDTTGVRDRARMNTVTASMRTVLKQAPADEIKTAIEKTRSAGATCDFLVASLCKGHSHIVAASAELVERIVRLDADYRHCRAVGDQDQTARLRAQLVADFDVAVVDALVNGNRVGDAASLVLSVATLTDDIPTWQVSDAMVRVVQACAAEGQLALIEEMAGDPHDHTSPFNYNWSGPRAVARGAARRGHIWLLERALEKWPSSRYSESAVAHAVDGGHVDCVRWLCDRGFTCHKKAIWCPTRCADVSALTLALTSGRRDMVNAMVGANSVDIVARNAYESAVAFGDLRSARTICSVWPRTAKANATSGYGLIACTPLILDGLGGNGNGNADTHEQIPLVAVDPAL